MNDLSLQGSLTASAMALFVFDPSWRSPRRGIGRVSLRAVFLSLAVLVALTAISLIAAAAQPLNLADVGNQF